MDTINIAPEPISVHVEPLEEGGFGVWQSSDKSKQWGSVRQDGEIWIVTDANGKHWSKPFTDRNDAIWFLARFRGGSDPFAPFAPAE